MIKTQYRIVITLFGHYMTSIPFPFVTTLIRKSFSNPLHKPKSWLAITQKNYYVIFVRDRGFEPLTYPTSRGRSTN